MAELVQLDRRHESFEKRGVRVVVVSVEGTEDAAKTQAQFPRLTVLADESLGLSKALGVIHEHAGPDGSDIDTPTTVLVDKRGTVRWLYRSPSVAVRLSPDEVLNAIDEHLH